MSKTKETAERIARHHLDSERVSVTQFCDIVDAINQALQQAIADERERAARIAEDHKFDTAAHRTHSNLCTDAIATAIRHSNLKEHQP